MALLHSQYLMILSLNGIKTTFKSRGKSISLEVNIFDMTSFTIHQK